MDFTVTLKFWHGGAFKRDKFGVLRYVGAECRTLTVDPDELCGFYLEELAVKVSGYVSVRGVYYLVPGKSLNDGLRKVFDDNVVREMGELLLKSRMVELFVYHGGELPELGESSQPVLKPKRNKLTPKRAPHRQSPRRNILGQVDKVVGSTRTSLSEIQSNEALIPTQASQTPQTPDNPNSPIHTAHPEEPVFPTQTSIHLENPNLSTQPLTDDDDSDTAYTLEGESYDTDTSGDEYIDFDEFREDPLVDDDEEFGELDGDDSTDEEFVEAREKARGFNQNLLEIARQLQEDAACAKLAEVEGSEQQLVETGDKDKELGYISDYVNSEDEQETPPESDDEDTLEERRSRRSLVVGVNTDFSQFQWRVGQRFPNKDAFKDALSKYAVLQGRQLGVCISHKSRGERIGVSCTGSCPFKLYASWDTRRACYVVKTVRGEHQCIRNMVRNKQLKTSWLARQMLDVFKARPHWPAKEIIETVRRAYKVVVEAGFAYKVKYHAHKMLHGSMKEHYMKVGKYLEALRRGSPGSLFVLVKDPAVQQLPPVFQRFFVSFQGLQQGWNDGCRKIICVDGCFIKTFLGGQLLSAIGRDGNEQMYPIAWAVTEGENNSSWQWFLEQLQRALNLGDGTDLVLVSDQHQAIISSIKEVLPNAEHRHCARHVYASWHKSYKGDNMKLLFWNCVKAYSIADFNEAMSEMQKVSEDAAIKFRSYDPKLFCRAFFKTTTKSDVVTSNMVETFNNYIINARTKHLLYMLEDIRSACMQRLVVKKNEAQKWVGNITPRVKVKLEKMKLEAANCDVVPSSAILFQVNHWLDCCVVDLEARSCTCRKWDLTGIPCYHACAALYFQNLEPEEYVHETLTKAYYLRAYAGSIPPCEGERHWPEADLPLEPPPIKIGPGRPRKNRRKDPHESPKNPGKLSRHGIEMTCKYCHVKGHNKRGCPDKEKYANMVDEQPQAKRGRGRPRKDGQPTQPRQIQSQSSLGEITAEPTRVGRGGRTIRGGRGSRGRGNGTSARGRGRVPQGFGVYLAPDGNAYVNEPTQTRARVVRSQSRAAQLRQQGRHVTRSSVAPSIQQGSQGSTLTI